MKDLSPSKKTAVKVIHEAFEILKEKGNELSGKEIMNQIGKKIELTTWEKEILEKTGNIRWQSILHFYTIDSIKAGYLKKDHGIWYLTKEGLKALETMTPEELLDSATFAYRKWKSEQSISKNEKDNNEEIENNNESQSRKANIDQLEDQALSQIQDFIKALNPYEFQDLVAALFRGMGYFTPFVSPKGKDHGVDIIAYKDPLGIEKPIIKIQCKHYPDTAVQSQDVQKLKGTLAHDEDVGILVTSGRFSEGAKTEARTSKLHIELIDFSRLIILWKQFYVKLSDEDKNILPMQQIYFLGSNE